MKKNIYLIFLFFIVWSQNVHAQCDQALVEKTISMSGKDALFLREFIAKYKKPSRKNPAPISKFSCYLKENAQYRFNYLCLDTSMYLSAMKLYSTSGQELASISKNQRNFEFICKESGVHTLLVSFVQPQISCIVVVLSLVVNDASIKSGVEKNKISENELYLGIENPLSVENLDPNDHIEFKIEDGEIIYHDSMYFAKVFKLGKTNLTVISYDSGGQVRDVSITEFEVREYPMPSGTLAGKNGGLISLKEISLANEIQVRMPQGFESKEFQIHSFCVGSFGKSDEKCSYSNAFTFEQKRFLSQLNHGNQFLIYKIFVKYKNGNMFELAPLGFIIE